MSNLLKKEKGFTLIEVVLVLAIAGLLLVIVFLALTGAQRSRRDTARKNDAARMLSAVESCAGNNGGLYTNCMNTAQLITQGYFTGASPNGVTYTVVNSAPPATPVDGRLYVQAVTCPGATSGNHSVAVSQEAGRVYCTHN